MVLKNKLIFVLVGMLLLNLTLATAAVTFKLEIPNQDNIKAGDTFSIKVLLDVPAGEDIKNAEFILTPSSSVTITSATAGGLLLSLGAATTTFNAQQSGGGYKYGETIATSGSGVSGNNLLFATLTATAGTAGSTTFTFSGLKAKKGVTARSVTSTSTTITIQGAADLCASVTCQNSGTCSNGLCSCVGGYTGTNCETPPLTCTAVAATCDQAGVSCPGNTPILATGCSTGQNCVNHACVALSDKAAKKTAACEQITAATEGPTGWTPQWVSQLAQKLKEIFS